MQHITIMTEEEHEMFRDFLKQRATLEANVTKGFNDLLAEHLRLCSAVFKAIEETAAFHTPDGQTVRRFRLSNQTAAARAIKLAKRALEP